MGATAGHARPPIGRTPPRPWKAADTKARRRRRSEASPLGTLPLGDQESHGLVRSLIAAGRSERSLHRCDASVTENALGEREAAAPPRIALALRSHLLRPRLSSEQASPKDMARRTKAHGRDSRTRSAAYWANAAATLESR